MERLPAASMGRRNEVQLLKVSKYAVLFMNVFLQECWKFGPFEGVKDVDGKIYGRGAQDTKEIGIQYIEALRRMFDKGQRNFLRTVHVVWGPGWSFSGFISDISIAVVAFVQQRVSDEELGGADGMEKFVNDPEFAKLNIGFVLDEGLAAEDDAYKVYFAEKCPWCTFYWIVSCREANINNFIL